MEAHGDIAIYRVAERVKPNKSAVRLPLRCLRSGPPIGSPAAAAAPVTAATAATRALLQHAAKAAARERRGVSRGCNPTIAVGALRGHVRA